MKPVAAAMSTARPGVSPGGTQGHGHRQAQSRGREGMGMGVAQPVGV